MTPSNQHSAEKPRWSEDAIAAYPEPMPWNDAKGKVMDANRTAFDRGRASVGSRGVNTDREGLRATLSESLREVAWVCGRVWEAWQYNTMTEDDFSPAWENDELLDSMVDEILALPGQQLVAEREALAQYFVNCRVSGNLPPTKDDYADADALFASGVMEDRSDVLEDAALAFEAKFNGESGDFIRKAARIRSGKAEA